VLDKTLKSGHLIPPLLLNFQWVDATTSKDRQEVYFFPFLTKNNVRRRQRSMSGQRPGYKEFNYVGLVNAPQMRLFPPVLRRAAVSPDERVGTRDSGRNGPSA
jgi:hypothetical protein